MLDYLENKTKMYKFYDFFNAGALKIEILNDFKSKFKE